jgi:S-(hydroxymethyl)glutathione dehydrogenase / alcohol dehydrogenase
VRAAVLETPGRPLVVRDDVTIAAPGPGQVRIDVAHCGVCHSDLSIIDGLFPSPLPIVLGHEAAGVVERVGPGVTGLAAGDHVVLTCCPPCGTCYWCVRAEPSLCTNTEGLVTNTFADGSTGLSRDGRVVYRGVNLAAFAAQVLTPASGAVKIPPDVPLDVACVVGCAVQTGVGAVLNTARVEEGASVLVMGLGGIGLSVVQGARIAGAGRVIASDPVATRREAAAAFGATDVIDPAGEDVVGRARTITGVGVDYAFETAGRADLVTAGLAAARNGGTVVCVGAPPVDQAITIAPAALFTVSGKRLLGCVLGSCNSLREIPRLVALWQAGQLDLDGLVTRRRPLAEINEALDDLRASRGIRTVLAL